MCILLACDSANTLHQQTEDICAQALAQMLHPLKPPLTQVRRDSVSWKMMSEAAEVPYMRESRLLHHKDHMLAVSQCTDVQTPARVEEHER